MDISDQFDWLIDFYISDLDTKTIYKKWHVFKSLKTVQMTIDYNINFNIDGYGNAIQFALSLTLIMFFGVDFANILVQGKYNLQLIFRYNLLKLFLQNSLKTGTESLRSANFNIEFRQTNLLEILL